MDNWNISIALEEFLTSKLTIFLTYTEVTNFTIDAEIYLLVWVKGNKNIKIPIPKDLNTFIGILQNTIFAKERVVITWNVKNLFSYLKFRCPEFSPDIQARVIDLKYSEAFLNIKEKIPETWTEAMKRASRIVDNPNWSKINQLVHTPLATEVLPAIETFGLINQEDLRWDYCYYEIEEHVNGRLKCRSIADNFYLPHSWREDKKSKYNPGYEKKFIVLDYSHMEVSVLQWLSGDEALGEIIKSGEDVYAGIYRILAGKASKSDTTRQFVKSMFLPIVFGMQATRLSIQLNLSLKGAESLIGQIYEKFPTALSWVEKQQNKITPDCFGRVRDYEESYKVRAAVIQSPAAVICLEKLVSLHQQCKRLDLVASIHDAYIGIVEERFLEFVASEAKQLLESPSEFAPGLVLKVSCEIGSDLKNLRKIYG